MKTLPHLRPVRLPTIAAWAVAAVALGALDACAHAQRATVAQAGETGPRLPKRAHAGLAPVVDVGDVGDAGATGDDADADAVQGPSASAWLEVALDALQHGRPQAASVALRAALATGDLNDAGRTLAYWYVYVAEQAQSHGQNARNALADFVVVGQDVLALRQDVRFAERGGSDFVDRFDLEGRLARSRAILSLAWAGQVPSFGRSPEQAVPVRSSQEMAFFLELAPPCAHSLDWQATEEVLAGRPNLGAVTRVDLSCAGLAEPAHYFFATGDKRLLAGGKKMHLRVRKQAAAMRKSDQ